MGQQVYMASPEYQGRFFSTMQKAQEQRKPSEEKKLNENLIDREKVKEMFLFTEDLKI